MLNLEGFDTSKWLEGYLHCNSEVRPIEDEYHVIPDCPPYKDLRIKYIQIYYYKRPSFHRFIQLLTIRNNNKEQNDPGKYLVHEPKIRELLLQLNSQWRYLNLYFFTNVYVVNQT